MPKVEAQGAKGKRGSFKRALSDVREWDMCRKGKIKKVGRGDFGELPPIESEGVLIIICQNH